VLLHELPPPILMTASCLKPEFRRGSTSPKGLEGDCYNQLSYSLQQSPSAAVARSGSCHGGAQVGTL
jgi:hypothetical protein